MQDKTPLCDEESEIICLGAALCRRECCLDLLAEATEEMFANEENRIVFNAIQHCVMKGVEATKDHVMQAIAVIAPDSHRAAMQNLVTYLYDSGQFHTVKLQLPTLIESFMRREGVKAAEALFRQLQEGKKNVSDAFNDAVKALNNAASKEKDNYRESDQILDNLYDGHSLREVIAGEYIPMAGVFMGFPRLHKLLGGFAPSRLIIIGGRAGEGKTEFLCQLIMKVIKQKVPCLSISLEMSDDDYMKRLCGIGLGVAHDKIPDIHKRGKEYVDKYLAKEKELRGYINSMCLRFNGDLTAAHVDYLVERHVKEHGIKVVFIDYLGLLEGRTRNEDKYKVVSYNAMAMKKIAMKHGISVVCAAQLNRKSEDRANRIPIISDLRDSGEIEQAADQIILIRRDDEESIVYADVCKNRQHSKKELISYNYCVDTQQLLERMI